MGLFDLFSGGEQNKQAPKKKKRREGIGEYHGMRVEAISEEGDEVLFTGRFVIVPEQGIKELHILSEPVSPLDQEETCSVNLRGFMASQGFMTSQGMAVHMNATISPLRENVWHVDNLNILAKDNDRAFFRLDTNLYGKVTRVGSDDSDTYECLVRNISAGGVCFRVDEQLEIGDTVLLSARLLPDQEMEPLLCRVRRIMPIRGGNYYGCQFLELDPATEDQISKVVVQLQMERLKRQASLG